MKISKLPFITVLSFTVLAAILSLNAHAQESNPIIEVPFQRSDGHWIIKGDDATLIAPKKSDAIKTVEGIDGQGVQFQGVKDQAFEIKSKKLQALQEELATSIWVKPTKEDFRQASGITGINWNWKLSIESNGYINLVFLGEDHKKNSLRLDSAQPLEADKWYQIAYTYSLSNQTASLYINGELSAQSKKATFKLRDESGYSFLIGQKPSNYALSYASVSQLNIFDNALSSNAIAALYQKESAPLFERQAKNLASKIELASKKITDSHDKDAYLDVEHALNSVAQNPSPESYRRVHQAAEWLLDLDSRQQEVADSKYQDYKSTFSNALEQIRNYVKASSQQQTEQTENSVEKAKRQLYRTNLKSHEDRMGLSAVSSFVVDPFSHQRFLPQDYLDIDKISNSIDIVGAPGETLTASFILRPTDGTVEDFEIKPTLLTGVGEKQEIPADALDIRIVKVWYQDGTSAWSGNHTDPKQEEKPRVLTPELLLHDASLVKVDYKTQTNYLKLNTKDGIRYRDITTRDIPEDLKKVGKGSIQVDLPADAFPVADDAKTLQPLNIDNDTNQQFWITLKVPSDAKPDTYKAELQLSSKSGRHGNINFNVRVLPIQLGHPTTRYDSSKPYDASIYYNARISEDGKAYIGSVNKSEIQYKAELENMRDHDIDYAQNRTPMSPENAINATMKLHRDIFGSKTMLFEGPYAHNLRIGLKTDEKSLATLDERAKEVQELSHRYGFEEIYIYGIDELSAEGVLQERKIWSRLQDKWGIKIFVAGRDDISKKSADILDMLVAAGRPNKASAKRMHEHGNRIFSYANPQSAAEDPDIFRRNYGIYLWLHDYDGLSTYAYQKAYATAWNDFDTRKKQYRDESFTYPTTNGVLDTISWEGYAQAKRDVAYASHLQRLLENTKDSDKQEVKEAQEYLQKLTISEDTDLNQIRDQIIQHILQVGGN